MRVYVLGDGQVNLKLYLELRDCFDIVPLRWFMLAFATTHSGATYVHDKTKTDSIAVVVLCSL
jgi:hypothetical protein